MPDRKISELPDASSIDITRDSVVPIVVDIGGTLITSQATVEELLLKASSTKLGTIKLTGDLGGTPESPTVPGLMGKAPINSPTFTGTPNAPTPAVDDDSTRVATTAYVQDVMDEFAPINSPNFTGVPTAPTPPADDNSTKIATTEFVQGEVSDRAPNDSPTLTGTPNSTTPPVEDDSTRIATTAFVHDAITDAMAGYGGEPDPGGPAIPNIVNLPYVFSQSNTVVIAGTVENLTDSQANTGAVSIGASNTISYFQADLGVFSYIGTVIIGGGNPGGTSGGSGGTQVSQYINGLTIQISDDAVTWRNSTVINGVTDGIGTSSLFGFSVGAWGRYIRIYQPLATYIAISELHIQGYNQNSNAGTTLPSIISLPFTASQSSIYNGSAACTASYTNLTDGLSTTGGGTTTASDQWIMADLYDGNQTLRYVNSIAIAPGNLSGGFGGVAAYLTGKIIQVSTDNFYWNTVNNVNLQVDSNPVLDWYSVGAWCRYVRIYSKTSYLATTALVVKGY